TRVGGMMADLPEGWTDGLKEFLDTFPATLAEVHRLLTNNGIFIGRTQGVGAISGEEAVNYGFTGPNLRASGVAYDVRKDQPYYDYETYDFEVPVGKYGDCYDRYLVRMEEMNQSVAILRQALDRLPEGPINVDDPDISLPDKTDAMNDMESMIHHFKLITEGIKAPVAADCYFPVEASKGELGMYVVANEGDTKPVRWRVRPPSFVNISVLPKLAQGHLVSDLIMINASLDIVLGEIDR
ncbi:MAG: NADH-quinone oxidoreductase subunit D, partial [Gemmatimonadota bacterium]